MPKPAAIDNDFLNHLVQTRGEQNHVCALIQEFFRSLDLEPFLHRLIWQYETDKTNPVIRQLLSEKIVIPCALDDILMANGSARGRYYEMLVQEIYRELHGENYPCDVFQEWKYQKSLGEVHCIVMCMFLNCVCLLSDDKDAKDLRGVLERKTGCSIPICSRTDCRKYLQEHSRNCTLQSDDLRRLCHTRD